MNSAPVIAIDPAWLAGFLQMGDTFYPTGAYAHSYGLEALADEGLVRDWSSLREYLLASVLPSLATSELPLVWQGWQALDAPDWAKIERLSVLASALRSAKEARLASENIGRQRIELAATLRGHVLAQEWLVRAKKGDWPFSAALAAALEARVLGAPPEAALVAVFYGNIAGLLAAAMKILRLGQNGSQTLLTELMLQAPQVVLAAKAVAEEDIGWFNPWLDIAAARHEHAAARLFIS